MSVDNAKFLKNAPGPLVTPIASASGVDVATSYAMDPNGTPEKNVKNTILIQDAIAAILSVQIQSRTIPEILGKHVSSYAKPGVITEHRQDAFNEAREDIGEYVTHVDEYMRDKQLLAAALEQQYPGITQAIIEFGVKHGIERTESGTKVRVNDQTILTAEGSNDVVLPNGAYRSKLSANITTFAAEHGYPMELAINNSYENLTKLKESLPKPPPEFVPPLQVEHLGTVPNKRIDPMAAATFQPQPLAYVDELEHEALDPSQRRR
jgi:hypothetical protein